MILRRLIWQDSLWTLRRVEPKLKGQRLSAKDRRVLVTRIVAKAHSLTFSAGNAKRHEVFKKMGYLPADPSDIKLRVLPSARQATITSYFRK